MFFPESGSLPYGNWLLPLLIWHWEDGNLRGSYTSSCEDEGAWYYSEIHALFEFAPLPGEEHRVYAEKVCPEEGTCGGVAGAGDTVDREVPLPDHARVRAEALRQFEAELVRLLGPPPSR
jgi:hypothetical protein